MADGGPQALQPPLQPQNCKQHPVPPTQTAPPVKPGPVPQLNWSHFKLKFTGKPDEDVEAHLLGTNNWMHTHLFPEGVKFQRFCLALVGEARLWYESLRPISLD